MCSSSAIFGLLLLFLLELNNYIKHACKLFCAVFVYCVEMKKIINLLFDTFYSTKYFYAHLYAIGCHFCVGSFTYPNPMKILWYATWSRTMLL
jgi:hypothetical protein